MKYQGKESRTYLQAPTPRELDGLVASTRATALRQGMHEVDVIQRRRDPDGGYEATILAHNWNPIKWGQEKIGEAKEGWEEGEEIRRGAEYARDPEGEEREGLLEEEEERLKARRRAAKEEEGFEERVAGVRERYRTPEEERAVQDAERRASLELAREEEAAGLTERARRAEYEAAIAKKEAEVVKTSTARQELTKRKFELGKARRDEGFRAAGRVSKAFAPAGAPGGVAQFYMGRPGKGLYVPGTPSVEHLRESPAKRALQPHTERLRRAISPAAGTAMPIARTVIPSERLAQPLQYGFLRQFALPSGTSKLEQAIFAEVKANGDVDTLEHIEEELAKLGYSRRQIEPAVRALERKDLIERTGQEYVIR